MALSDSTILITGGSSGIGFALARQLVQRGNRVIICGRGAEALTRAQTVEPALIPRICDIADTDSRRALIDSSGLAFAPMADVPVYCATKAALHSFTLSLRHQLRHTAVKVVETAPPIVETGLGGDARSDGTKNGGMMSPDVFATEALALLDEDRDEVLVGLSIGVRQHGEALFERRNGG